MAHDIDPAEAIWKAIGSAEDDIEIFNHQVLVAVYIRPDKTKSGIYLTGQTRDEDRFQGKCGMILMKGEYAFEGDGKWFSGGETFSEGDWVFFRPSDGWSITINGVLCRILDDTSVRGRTKRPDLVF
jgi:co-chaperonin GroES (HSP10)